MKKIILFVLCLMPFALMGQSSNVRMVVIGTDVQFLRGQTALEVYGADATYLPIANPTAIGTLTTPILKVGNAASNTITSIDSISHVTGSTDINFFDGPDTLYNPPPFTKRINGSTIYVLKADSATYPGGYASLSDFKSTLTPRTNNVSALGSTSLMYSDLFLGDGSVTNFNNGDLSLTHSVNKLTLTGGQLSVEYANAANGSIYSLNTSTTSISKGIAGQAFASGGTGAYYGVHGTADATNTGTNIGVYGNAEGASTNWGVYSNGNMKTTSNIYITKSNVFTRTYTGNIVAGTGITSAMLNGNMNYNGNSAIDITANPQIADGADGQIIMIVGLDDTNTLTLDDGNGLRLNGNAQCVLGAGDIIILMFSGGALGDWLEISRSNN